MGKSSIYECSSCGYQAPKWSGQCPDCKSWNTLVEGLAPSKRNAKQATKAAIVNYEQVTKGESKRLSTANGELDRVLGGGLVPGEVVLVIGEPGIGKSTILTQLAVSMKGAVYVCGEESPSQVKLRVERLGRGSEAKSLQFLPELDVDVIVATLKSMYTPLLIVDSVQTIYTTEIAGQAGGVAQIKECTARLIAIAKRKNLPIILVGHVTKDGEMAGPKQLEHMVDAVLDLSGDRYHELRLLRAVKNRFGATDEVGVFRMSERGLEEVANPSKLFLGERSANEPGSCVAVIMEGSRPVLVEVQALVVGSELPVPRRVASGVDVRRVQLIIGVLEKHARLNLSTKDVFVKIAGGISVREPAIDLAVALAVASSALNVALPDESCAIGEVGLLGEVRGVTMYARRAKEAEKLGYSMIYSRVKNKKLAILITAIK